MTNEGAHLSMAKYHQVPCIARHSLVAWNLPWHWNTYITWAEVMSVATEVDFEEHSDEWKTFIVIYCSLPFIFHVTCRIWDGYDSNEHSVWSIVDITCEHHDEIKARVSVRSRAMQRPAWQPHHIHTQQVECPELQLDRQMKQDYWSPLDLLRRCNN